MRSPKVLLASSAAFIVSLPFAESRDEVGDIHPAFYDRPAHVDRRALAEYLYHGEYIKWNSTNEYWINLGIIQWAVSVISEP